MSKRRPPQGTHGNIRNVAREERLRVDGANLAVNITAVVEAMRTDVDLRAYHDAQIARDFDTIQGLLPVLRAQYGGPKLLQWHRAMRWKVDP